MKWNAGIKGVRAIWVLLKVLHNKKNGRKVDIDQRQLVF